MIPLLLVLSNRWTWGALIWLLLVSPFWLIERSSQLCLILQKIIFQTLQEILVFPLLRIVHFILLVFLITRATPWTWLIVNSLNHSIHNFLELLLVLLLSLQLLFGPWTLVVTLVVIIWSWIFTRIWTLLINSFLEEIIDFLLQLEGLNWFLLS